MTGIERQQLLPDHGASEVEFMRTGRETFAAAAEQLGFYGVLIQLGRNGLLEDGIQRFRVARAAAMPCLIQNLRPALSGCVRVKPPAAWGWEK